MILSNKSLSVNDSDTDTEKPAKGKTPPLKPSLKKIVKFSVFDEQKEEESEEEQGEEEEEDEVFDPVETPTKGKFNATSVIYDNNERYSRKLTKDASGRTDYTKLRQIRPPLITEDGNDNIYEIATSAIENKRLRRKLLADDPVYRFFIQVAGHANTLASNFGLPSIGNIGTGGSKGAISSQSSPVTSGSISSPKKGTPPVSSSTSYVGNLSTTRERLERLAYEKRLAEFKNDVTIEQSRKDKLEFELKKAEEDALENSRKAKKNDLISQTLEWVDKDEITGFSEIRPIMYACINAAHLAIVSSRAEWENVDVMDFINDSKMSILFAEIVAIHITIRRNFNSTTVSLDKSLARAYSWLSSRMDQLHRWTYEEYSLNGGSDHFTLNARISTYYIPPGAPARHRQQHSSTPASYRISGRVGSFSHNFFG